VAIKKRYVNNSQIYHNLAIKIFIAYDIFEKYQ